MWISWVVRRLIGNKKLAWGREKGYSKTFKDIFYGWPFPTNINPLTQFMLTYIYIYIYTYIDIYVRTYICMHACVHTKLGTGACWWCYYTFKLRTYIDLCSGENVRGKSYVCYIAELYRKHRASREHPLGRKAKEGTDTAWWEGGGKRGRLWVLKSLPGTPLMFSLRFTRVLPFWI